MADRKKASPKTRIILAVAAAVVVVVTLQVGRMALPSEKRAVRRTIDAVARATEALDAGAVARNLSPGFVDLESGLARSDLEDALQEAFGHLEEVEVRIRGVEIEVEGATALARVRALVTFEATGKMRRQSPVALPDKLPLFNDKDPHFELRFSREGKDWLIDEVERPRTVFE